MSILTRKSRRQKAAELNKSNGLREPTLITAKVKYGDMPLISSTKEGGKITNSIGFTSYDWQAFYLKEMRRVVGYMGIPTNIPTPNIKSYKEEAMEYSTTGKEGEKDIDYVEATDDDDWI